MISEQEAKNLKFGDVVSCNSSHFSSEHPVWNTGIVEAPVFGWFIDDGEVRVMLNLGAHGCRKVTPDFITEQSLQGASEQDLAPFLGLESGWALDYNKVVSVVSATKKPTPENLPTKSKDNVSADGKWISNIDKFKGENPPESAFRWL